MALSVPTSESRSLKYFLSAVEEAQKRPGGDTVRDECRTPSFDHPERNFNNPKGLSATTLVLTCFLNSSVMSAEGSRERFLLHLYQGWFIFSAVISLC